MRRKRRRKLTSKLLIITLILLAFLYGLYFEEINNTFALMYDEYGNAILTNIKDSNNETETSVTEEKDKLKIYYIDVGQADSILIQNENEFMLIDAGNNNDGPLLVKYFQSLNIKDFKYVVGTHPHEDHIGGLDDIITNFNIGTIYIPDAITTTKTFEDLLNSIEKKNMTFTVPKIDSTFNLGKANVKVIYTGTDTKDLNNTSIVLKMSFGSTTYLFTGDATSTTEKKILNKDISADVLKVGHHGSNYSSTDKFLNKVNPKYAIISVGKNNIYSHPATKTIDKLNKLNIKIYRTDELGTIILTSDGKNIDITNEKTNTNGG